MEEADRFLEHEVVGGAHVMRFQMSRLDDAEPLAALEDKVNQILGESEKGPTIVLNLGTIEYLVTTALAKLMTLRARVTKKGGKVILCGLQPAVREVMHITQFDTLFPIHKTEQDALAQGK